MNNYIKSVVFTLVLAASFWDVFCTNQKAASSASFIQQESNQQPIQPSNPQKVPQTAPGPNRGASRDYINPQNIPTPSVNPQNIPQPSPATSRSGSISTSTRAASRDYVNPNRANPQNIPQPGSAPSRSGAIQPNTPASTRGGSRDYVNPNIQQNSNGWIVPTQPTTIQSGSNRGAVRDYVNPSGRVTQGSSNPAGQQFRPSPRNSNLGGRDYVNPNNQGGVSYARIVGGSSNNPNALAGSSQNIPALPPTNNSPQNVPSTTPISYASKVSGGSKSPGQQKPFVSGPTTSTTQTPDSRSEEGPTDVELRDFSEALLRRDVNNAAKFLTVNLQGKTTSQSKNDQAPDRLLSIQQDAYKIPTISKLKLLHNNYILETSENEHVTAQEKLEENDLLDAMLTTPIMQHTRNFLISKGKLGKDPKDFKDLLKILWFNMYSRGSGRIGSSGFEHIFLAELKNNEVSGLHNWVYFDQAELNKIVDYLGYMKKVDLGEKGAILKFHFKLNGVDKPVGSMFIGTSPELEMALYTTCYLFRKDKICPIRLNGNNFIIRTYNYRYRGKNMIGSAFPEI